MAEINISQNDINDLAAKLENLQLSTDQRALLSAMVAAAAKTVVGQLTNPDPPIKQQFIDAFTPGRAELLVKITHITKGP